MQSPPRTTSPSPPFILRRGAPAVWAGRAVRILATCGVDQIQVRIEGTGEIQWTTAEALRPYVPEIPAPAIRHPTNVDPDAEAHALAWADALAALPAQGRASAAARDAIAAQMGVHVRTVDRRYARYLANPLPGAQLSGFPGPRCGSRLLSPSVEAIVDRAIDEVYLTRERKPITAVATRVKTLCVAAGLDHPSYGAIRARIRNKDPLVAAKRRLGAQEGAVRQAPSIKGLTVSRALEVVQIDHARVDLIVVSPTTRLPVGRPWITLAIDVHTRCILGYYLGFETPNQTAVGICLEHACFPKNTWLAEMGVEASYPMFGKMESIHWDNAKTFQAQAVQSQCQRYDIFCKPRPIKQPHFGAYIERYIGTFMGKVHLLPGTTFSNPKERGSYDSEKNAVLSMAELHRWVALEIAGTYHHSPHRGLDGRTPAEAWTEAWRRPDGTVAIPPMIADRREFVLGFLPFVHRAITREGIALHGLHYWDPALTPLINDKQRYPVHYHQDKLSMVFLRHGSDYLDIPLVDRSQPTFSLQELKDAKQSAALKHDTRANEAKVFAAIAQQRDIEDAAAGVSKKARRKQARRPEPSSAPPVSSADYAAAPPTLDASWADVP